MPRHDALSKRFTWNQNPGERVLPQHRSTSCLKYRGSSGESTGTKCHVLFHVFLRTHRMQVICVLHSSFEVLTMTMK